MFYIKKVEPKNKIIEQKTSQPGLYGDQKQLNQVYNTAPKSVEMCKPKNVFYILIYLTYLEIPKSAFNTS